LAGLINELISLLEIQTKGYDELLVLSKEKRRVVIENDVDMLSKITQAENSIIGQTQKAEAKRLEVMNDMATVLGQNPDDLTIKRLAELIEGQAEHNNLVEAGKRLRAVLDELKEENDRNSVLIQSSLDYIDFTVNLVRQASSLSDPYADQKKTVPGTDSGFFDKSR
jgi:flagellar biosynthesis/type III secretory pathway chaperone